MPDFKTVGEGQGWLVEGDTPQQTLDKMNAYAEDNYDLDLISDATAAALNQFTLILERKIALEKRNQANFTAAKEQYLTALDQMFDEYKTSVVLPSLQAAEDNNLSVVDIPSEDKTTHEFQIVAKP
jgi:hypothetical protein